MLIYHPATDFFHCWMRVAAVLFDSGKSEVEFDRIRIVDYFLCFPSELNLCRLPGKLAPSLRKEIKAIPALYEDPQSTRKAFPLMNRVQTQVAMDMVSKAIVRPDRYREGILCPNTNVECNLILQKVSNEWAARSFKWYKLAVESLCSLPLTGDDGLKARTGLLEYRYDG